MTLVWRAEYRVMAYRDQTGRWREGYVVFERLELTATGETTDRSDGYGGTLTERVYQSKDGRRFRYRPPTDYGAEGSYTPEKPPNIRQGYWMRARTTTEGCVDMDGNPLR